MRSIRSVLRILDVDTLMLIECKQKIIGISFSCTVKSVLLLPCTTGPQLSRLLIWWSIQFFPSGVGGGVWLMGDYRSKLQFIINRLNDSFCSKIFHMNEWLTLARESYFYRWLLLMGYFLQIYLLSIYLFTEFLEETTGISMLRFHRTLGYVFRWRSVIGIIRLRQLYYRLYQKV